jgi:hypothetical protein
MELQIDVSDIPLSLNQKQRLINQVIAELKIEAHNRKDYLFNEGDLFFALAFKSDQELVRLAKLCGVKL